MSIVTLVASRAIVLLQDDRTVAWHADLHPQQSDDASLDTCVLMQHRANFELWHAEDEARSSTAGDAVIASLKRRIDSVNQQRNDATEGLDALLLDQIDAERDKESLQETHAEQHSETPGMMIDRLSILSLKLFHTQEEIDRRDAPAGHRERNLERLAILQQQRNELAQCLDRLWKQVCAGERCFKLYRQLKMYNDPELNPVLYHQSRSQA